MSSVLTRSVRSFNFLRSVQSKFASPWAKPHFVDGVNGADTYNGDLPESALKTIQAAVTAAAKGDVIYIRPLDYVLGRGFERYTEDVIVPLAKHDLSIVGINNGFNPEGGVRWKHVVTPLTVRAAALHLENIGFFCEGATRAINYENDGNVSKVGSVYPTLYNCAIKGSTILIDSGDGAKIEKCYFHAQFDGAVTGGIEGVTTGGTALRRLSIKDCMFFGGNGVAAATAFIILTGGTITETEIDNCRFGKIPASGKYIVNTSVTGGILSNSFFANAALHRTNHLTLSGMIMAGCFDGSGGFVA